MSQELPKAYEPKQHEARITQKWLDHKAFKATPDGRESYVVMMPLPNVTGALHMGHAMDNVMQDLLIRWNRMQGKNTLWQPGTDHAGIATQAVVEKRLKELEGKTRHDVGREALVKRIWAWKDEYQERIVSQQQAMGCSCDWDRHRFTMDDVCSSAVREAFFRLFQDRLIFRGDRLVNWDCHLQTAVANDEVYYEKVDGHFWHLKYPFINAQEGEPDHVLVATTRPETMLGDTAVACHPDPEGALNKRESELRERLTKAGDKERPEIEEALTALTQRRQTHLPKLKQLAEMAKAGRKLRLPLMNREIPLIADEWAKPELGSGCVKITPAHDPNDYLVWQRHSDEIEIINILNDDGTFNDQAGDYQGLDRRVARDQVVADLEGQGFLHLVEDRPVEIGHSDRSKTPIEPYLSKQWYVRMGDTEEGVDCGAGTAKAFRSPGLAQAAIDAAEGEWTSPSGLKLDFHPDRERYRSSYVNWLSEKRDWCVSRQLWWGHQIPVWWARFDSHQELEAAAKQIPVDPDLHVWVGDTDGGQHDPGQIPTEGTLELQVCSRSLKSDEKFAKTLEELGLRRDPDVLDTWFSSALWPFSTLGWPAPDQAPINPGQTSLEDALEAYYPGSCLVTGRDILTLWVARMVIMGLYFLGDLPFTDVFLHAKILDGKGETMSKSKGNGIDPVDIIERYGTDAMRYLVCDMQTGMQDVRLPVQAICPYTGDMIDLAKAKHGRTADGHINRFTYISPSNGKEFDVLGTMPNIPSAKIISERFEAGKQFCNKLWNAARFAMMNLGELEFQTLKENQLAPEDRWILSRLSRAISAVDEQLALYNPSAALSQARDFFWNELCDWYLELIKPRMKDNDPVARQVLALALDQTLRLLHPFTPFVTEVLWEQLGKQAPQRGLENPLDVPELCIKASWPKPQPKFENDALESTFETMRETVRAIRDLKAKYNVPPRQELPCAIKTEHDLNGVEGHIRHLASLSEINLGPAVEPPSNSAMASLSGVEIYLGEVLDPKVERERLEKQLQDLEKRVRASEGKLKNEKFVSKAPEAVVQAERDRLSDMKTQLSQLEESMAALAR
jgi:valyl-tRNA synthetase